MINISLTQTCFLANLASLMTATAVLTNPNPDLRISSEPVSVSELETPELTKLIADLIDTMRAENGVGIAAPQVGIRKRVIIVDTGENTPQAFLNPEIVSTSLAKIDSEEGCLSVPGVFGIVRRHKWVKVRAMMPNGDLVEIKAEGFPATIFQHETDHLNGVLFIDKVTRYTKPPQHVL